MFLLYMSQPNIGFLNLNVDGSLPVVFNPATFRTSAIQSDQLSTQTLSVSSTTNTNGIVDYNSIEAKKISVQNEAIYSGNLIPNSSCIATTYYVDDKINTIMGGTGINTLLDSISEINQALNNDPNYANTIGLRISQNEVNTQNNANSIGQLNNDISDINDSLVSIDTRINTNASDIDDIQTSLTQSNQQITSNTNAIGINSNNITTNTNSINSLTSSLQTANTNISTLQTQTTTNTNSISSINSVLPTKANINNPSFTGTANFNTLVTNSLTDNGNITIKGNTIIGDQTTDTLTVTGNTTFNQPVTIQSVNVKNKLDSLDSSVSTINTNITNLQTSKANDNTVVHISGNETLSGVKTFSNIPKIGLNDVATTNDINTAINNLINSAPSTLDTLGEISTVLQNNQNDVNTIISTMVTLGTNQTITGVKTFSSNPQVNTLTQGDNSNSVATTSYVDTGLTNLNSNISSTYLTQSNATSTYQTQSGMSSYPRLTTSNTFTNFNEYSSDIIQNKLVEKYIVGTVSSNAMSINYSTTTNNIFSISPSSATNIALTITNLPTNRGTAIYNFTFLINTSTNKNYINSLNVNGSSITMRASGGLANVSVNTSSVLVIQTLNIMMNGATVSNALTSVISTF